MRRHNSEWWVGRQADVRGTGGKRWLRQTLPHHNVPALNADPLLVSKHRHDGVVDLVVRTVPVAAPEPRTHVHPNIANKA